MPTDHPLRRVRPVELTPSPHAVELAVPAQSELTGHLHGPDPISKDIIGFVAAAGGGLTAADLAAQAGAPYIAITERLSTGFGRVLRARLRARPGAVAITTYHFAHETLASTAEALLGSDLTDARERLHRWADRYRHWPADTPAYLGLAYSDLLRRTG